MPRFRPADRLRLDGDEVFDENWMDRDTIQMPPTKPWTGDRPPRVEEIDTWEVIAEGGGVGVYAAWCPRAELYVVAVNGRVVEEFSGFDANGRLEKWLIAWGVPYDKAPDTPLAAFAARAVLL